MARHIVVTFFLVAGIFAALLWLNQGLVQYNMPTEANETSLASTTTHATTTNPTPKPPATIIAKTPSKTPVKSALLTDTIIPEHNSSAAAHTLKSFTITGIAVDINLKDETDFTHQSTIAWQRFNQNTPLHNSMSWAANSHPIYAYYYAINSQFTKAKLIIGYHTTLAGEGLTTVAVQTGQYQTFAFDTQGLAPTAAWDYAYPSGEILERYTIDLDGNINHQDVLVIK